MSTKASPNSYTWTKKPSINWPKIDMADGFLTPLNGFVIITLRLIVFGAHLMGTLGKWLICLSLE